MKNQTLIALGAALLAAGAGLAQAAQEAPAPGRGGDMQTRGAMNQGQMMGQMGQGPMMTPEMRQGMAGMMQNCQRMMMMMSRMSSEGRPPQPRR